MYELTPYCQGLKDKKNKCMTTTYLYADVIISN